MPRVSVTQREIERAVAAVRAAGVEVGEVTVRLPRAPGERPEIIVRAGQGMASKPHADGDDPPRG